MSDTDFPLPPASFEFLTASLKMQAEIQLGLLHFGDEKDRPAPNLPLARHSIDMLAMLVEKTKGNLSTEEQRHIENTVTELRFRYIQALEHRNSQTLSSQAGEGAPGQEPARTEEQAAT